LPRLATIRVKVWRMRVGYSGSARCQCLFKEHMRHMLLKRQ
jgi:hypothetical protein